MHPDERYAFAARHHSNFSVAINKDFSITTRTSVIADTSTLAAISTRASVPLPHTLTTTELLLCNVINVEGLGTRRVHGYAKKTKGTPDTRGGEGGERAGNTNQVAITVRGCICSEVICKHRERRKSIAGAVVTSFRAPRAD